MTRENHRIRILSTKPRQQLARKTFQAKRSDSDPFLRTLDAQLFHYMEQTRPSTERICNFIIVSLWNPFPAEYGQ